MKLKCCLKSQFIAVKYVTNADVEVTVYCGIDLGASAIAITARLSHTCAILVGGGVKCWGSNWDGQLGYDSTDKKGDEAGDTCAALSQTSGRRLTNGRRLAQAVIRGRVHSTRVKTHKHAYSRSIKV